MGYQSRFEYQWGCRCRYITIAYINHDNHLSCSCFEILCGLRSNKQMPIVAVVLWNPFILVTSLQLICGSPCVEITIIKITRTVLSFKKGNSILVRLSWDYLQQTGMSLELRFLARFQWREAYVLDNWQLAELPQSGGREFDPRRVHDNLSVPLWVYMRFPVPEHQN